MYNLNTAIISFKIRDSKYICVSINENHPPIVHFIKLVLYLTQYKNILNDLANMFMSNALTYKQLII